MKQKFYFCEKITASSTTRWHIRTVTSIGPKFGGGADTPALCGEQVSWDLMPPISKHHLNHCCSKCKTLYTQIIKSKNVNETSN